MSVAVQVHTHHSFAATYNSNGPDGAEKDPIQFALLILTTC